MKCPYCGKRTGDMPDHLKANKKCHEKHKEYLKIMFLGSYGETKKRDNNED